MNRTHYVNENGAPDTIGTDGGIIVADEEHELGARLTLERTIDCRAFSITSGIYGWMVHTCRYPSLEPARAAFDAMKLELNAIVEAIPNRSDPQIDEKLAIISQSISSFVDRFP